MLIILREEIFFIKLENWIINGGFIERENCVVEQVDRKLELFLILLLSGLYDGGK